MKKIEGETTNSNLWVVWCALVLLKQRGISRVKNKLLNVTAVALVVINFAGKGYKT